MKKVRNFKLTLHFKELRRRARKAADLPALGLDREEDFKAFLDQTASRLMPAVLFESFSATDDTAVLAPVPGLAHTLALVTLGPELPIWIQTLRTERAEIAPVLETIRRAALEWAVQFVLGLLKAEVEAERCDLSPIGYLGSPEALEAVCAKLESHKIGVGFQEGHLTPESASAFCVSWLARQKSRAKSAAESKGQVQTRSPAEGGAAKT